MNNAGNPDGLINELKEMVQGVGFWRDQEKTIIKRINALERYPAEDAMLKREMATWEKEDRQEEERLYREHPEFRPSKADLKVERLRERADEIDEQQLMKELEQDRLSELSKLKGLLMIAREKQAK